MFDGSPALPTVGQVVGDEPQAVGAGATVLAHGGNAADAAAATYFVLSVTLPVAAGVGGGGICIVYNSSQRDAEEFDFLPRDTAGGGPYAIPGNVAGIALLQSTYGRLPWQRIISPAESFAGAGFSVSRALSARLATSEDTIRLDAELAREFLDEAGRLKPTDSIVVAPALAQTLSHLRTEGAGALYKGTLAGEITDYAHAQGGDITAGELSSYRPERNVPLRIPVDGKIAFLPSDRAGAGRYARALMARLVDAQRRRRRSGDRRDARVSQHRITTARSRRDGICRDRPCGAGRFVCGEHGRPVRLRAHRRQFRLGARGCSEEWECGFVAGIPCACGSDIR